MMSLYLEITTTVDLGTGNDKIDLDGNDNTLNAGAGNDEIIVWGSNNQVDGGTGYDLTKDYGRNTTVRNAGPEDRILIDSE